MYILYKIYILQNMFHSKTARESKPKIRRIYVWGNLANWANSRNLRLMSQKIRFQ